MMLTVSYLRVDYFLPIFKPSLSFTPVVPVGSLPTPFCLHLSSTTHFTFPTPFCLHFSSYQKMQTIPKPFVWDYPFSLLFLRKQK